MVYSGWEVHAAKFELAKNKFFYILMAASLHWQR